MTATIVLLHGASGNAATWTPTLPAWAGLDVVAIDLPGRGESAHVPPVSTAAEAAQWLTGELVRRAIVQPVLVGHSYGGAVALEAALAAPDQLGGIVLASSASRLRVAPVILQAVAEATPDAPFRLDFAFGPDCPKDVVDRYHQDAASTPTAAGVADWNACNCFDVRARLGEIDLPALAVWGSEDRLTVAKYQGKLVEALPRGEGVELAGIGHMLPWEAPEALAGAVRDWVGRIPG